ncbi:hypothetical protein ACLOJK_029477 [Asimina triloba]
MLFANRPLDLHCPTIAKEFSPYLVTSEKDSIALLLPANAKNTTWQGRMQGAFLTSSQLQLRPKSNPPLSPIFLLLFSL